MIEPVKHPPIHTQVAEYTMGQPEDVGYMQAAIEYVCAHDIPGAIVECGIYQGGMVRAALLALEGCGCQRPVWGYDTFCGMTAPTKLDEASEKITGQLAASYDDVRGYVGNLVCLVTGDVRETLPLWAPQQVAVLRLDVDFYEPTLACLNALWPRLAVGGFLFIDDYNYWPSCKLAVDEFLGERAAELVRTGTGSGMQK